MNAPVTVPVIIAQPDKMNTLNVKAGPVKGEQKVDNNEMEMQFTMRSEGT